MSETVTIGNSRTGTLEIPVRGFITVGESRAHSNAIVALQEEYGADVGPQAELELAVAQAFYKARVGRELLPDCQKAAAEVGLKIEAIDDVPFTIIHELYELQWAERNGEKPKKKTVGNSPDGSSDTISPVNPASDSNSSTPALVASSTKR